MSMEESERQYWLGHIAGKKAVIEEILSAYPKLDGLTSLVLEYAHVSENYLNGWDVVAETYDRPEVIIAIIGAETLAEALARFSVVVDVHRDRCENARNSAF